MENGHLLWYFAIQKGIAAQKRTNIYGAKYNFINMN
jgi:hypothetical protein